MPRRQRARYTCSYPYTHRFAWRWYYRPPSSPSSPSSPTSLPPPAPGRARPASRPTDSSSSFRKLLFSFRRRGDGTFLESAIRCIPQRGKEKNLVEWTIALVRVVNVKLCNRTFRRCSRVSDRPNSFIYCVVIGQRAKLTWRTFERDP